MAEHGIPGVIKAYRAGQAFFGTWYDMRPWKLEPSGKNQASVGLGNCQ
jgi:hypothetical protein